MNALLWKEYRANFPLVIVGIVLILAPYILWTAFAVHNLNESGSAWNELLWWLNKCAFLSLALSQLTISLVGGQIIATERQNRTAEFLFYLPPSRTRIAGSKLLLCAFFAVVIWTVGLTALFAIQTANQIEPSLSTLEWIAVPSFALFGVAWLGSSFMNSETSAIIFSILICISIAISVSVLSAWLGFEDEFAENVLFTVYLLAGIGGIVCGFLNFIRRIEP